MERSDLRREVSRFDPRVPIERAWTPPASWYTEASFLELERRAVFASSWQPLARVAELEGPGSFVSGVFQGEPWVVLRDGGGALRAFSNVCLHKGREVVQGCGRADELVCGYHAWRYGLDGSLRSAPRVAGIQDFDREALSMAPLALEVWGPWVFVNFDGRAAPLRAGLGELDARLERSGWNDLVFVQRRSWSMKCNWKVYVDNYLDGGYHIPHMHPSLDAQIDMSSYGTEIFERFSIQGARAAPDGDERIDYEARARVGEGPLYAWLHPNFMLNRYGPCLDTNLVLPRGPRRCEVVYEFYFEPGLLAGSTEEVEASMRQSDVTQQEDIAISESVQVGLGSRAYDRGRYAPQVEVGEHHFHRLLAAEYLAALDADRPEA